MTWLNDDLIAEVRAVWGDLLRPLPAERVPAALSAPTREFLTTVGLPTVEVGTFAPLPDAGVLVSTHLGGREYVPVVDGLLGDHRFAVDVDSDKVFCLFDGSADVLFANSDVGLFVLYIGRFFRDLWELPEPDEENLSSAVGGIVESLMAQDPPALDKSAWWPPTLYQAASDY
jgi:hypothetical protein